jgi:2-oxoglutarate ferredoxin oxidoreductase subunit alpha
MSRRGPGIGGLQPTQSSYRQATKGGGHGGYRCIVLSPSSVQEAASLMYDAFELADKWRNPVYMYADGLIGQVMEPVVLPEMVDVAALPEKPWALTGKGDRKDRNMVSSGVSEEKFEYLMFDKYKKIEQEEQRWQEKNLDDAEYVVAAFGSVGRIASTAVDRVRKATGKKIGMIRPITIWPFASTPFMNLPDSVKGIMVIEANGGQMVEDVVNVVKGRFPVYFEHTYGSLIPAADEVAVMVEKLGTGQEVRW